MTRADYTPVFSAQALDELHHIKAGPNAFGAQINHRINRSMKYQIVPARAEHIPALAMGMRTASIETYHSFGADPEAMLFQALRESFSSWVALIDGKPEAIWGLATLPDPDADGQPIEGKPRIWVSLSERLMHSPVGLTKAIRRHLVDLAGRHRAFFAIFDPRDEKALLAAIFHGFRDRYDGQPRTRREWLAEMKAAPDSRIPVGDGYLIGLSWHGGR